MGDCPCPGEPAENTGYLTLEKIMHKFCKPFQENQKDFHRYQNENLFVAEMFKLTPWLKSHAREPVSRLQGQQSQCSFKRGVCFYFMIIVNLVKDDNSFALVLRKLLCTCANPPLPAGQDHGVLMVYAYCTQFIGLTKIFFAQFIQNLF